MSQPLFAQGRRPDPMIPVNAARLALPIRRKDALVRNAGLSVLLHLLLLAAFLAKPHPGELTQATGPISVEIVPDVGTSDGQRLPTPSFAPGVVAPSEAPATEPPPPASVPRLPVPEADVPSTSAPEPPSPAAPPVPPATTASSAAEAPPVAPSPPVAAAAPVPALEATPPPPPAPAPLPAPAPQQFALVPPLPLPPTPAPPPRAVARPPARPAPRAPTFPAPVPFASLPFAPRPRATPNHTSNGHGALDLSLGPEALNSLGAPPRTSNGVGADIRVEGAEVGNDWIEQLHEWWNSHSFYPQAAITNNEDGVVEVHMVITRDGRVQSVEVVSSSGSRWLDMAGVSVFRNAHLQPFPLSTPEDKADVYAFLHYILVHG